MIGSPAVPEPKPEDPAFAEDSDSRGDVRVPCVVDVTFEVVSPVDAERIQRAVRNAPTVHNLDLIEAVEHSVHEIEAGRDDGVPSVVLHKLLEIDAKLDRLLAVLLPARNPGGLHEHGSTLDLSASGMRLRTSVILRVEACLHLEMEFPLAVPVRLRLVGQVARHIPAEKATGEPPTVGVRFLAIHPDDQEWLIRHLFARQRELIRQGKKPAAGA